MGKSLDMLGLDKSVAEKDVNVGLSGGERKRAEILQALVFRPKFAILDEPDSGLDIDSLKAVANAINSMHSESVGTLLITHYQRIFSHVNPDAVHVMINGKIIVSGGQELVQKLEEKGYEWLEGNRG
jgi:Fe-S cluster assembly ATP-binding protein